MDSKQGNQLHRHLATLKVISRLLGHELHAQGAAKTLTLSRDQVMEIQTSLDLYIEEASRRMSANPGAAGDAVKVTSAKDPRMVTARN